MGIFRPYASYENASGRLVLAPFADYRQLRQALPRLLDASPQGKVKVYRYRRGQPGEWYEEWGRQGKSPRLLSNGWS